MENRNVTYLSFTNIGLDLTRALLSFTDVGLELKRALRCTSFPKRSSESFRFPPFFGLKFFASVMSRTTLPNTTKVWKPACIGLRNCFTSRRAFQLRPPHFSPSSSHPVWWPQFCQLSFLCLGKRLRLHGFHAGANVKELLVVTESNPRRRRPRVNISLSRLQGWANDLRESCKLYTLS